MIPAKSNAQQKAVGTALAAKQAKTEDLRGVSQEMAVSMTERDLARNGEHFARGKNLGGSRRPDLVGSLGRQIEMALTT